MKTTFEIDILATDGYLRLRGRARTDGPQELIIGKRWGWTNGKSQAESEIFLVKAIKDDSLIEETKKWIQDSSTIANSNDGLRAMELHFRILGK